MCRTGSCWAHLVEAGGEAALRQLPGRLAARQAAADYRDSGQVIRRCGDGRNHDNGEFVRFPACAVVSMRARANKR